MKQVNLHWELLGSARDWTQPLILEEKGVSDMVPTSLLVTEMKSVD